MIRIDAVTKSYGATRVLDGVSLDIPAGGITSLIGANGAGKSTLLSIASRLLPADAGRVRVDGMDVATTPGPVLARRLAVLRQENSMTVRLTVRELVSFGRFPHSGGRLTAEDRRLIDEALDWFELGLLVANLARQLLGTHRHAWVLPGAALLAVLALVGGQLVLEQVFGFNSALSIVINFVGGIVFIALLIREPRQ